MTHIGKLWRYKIMKLVENIKISRNENNVELFHEAYVNQQAKLQV